MNAHFTSFPPGIPVADDSAVERRLPARLLAGHGFPTRMAADGTEACLEDHFNASFSHALCDECLRTFYPEASGDADVDRPLAGGRELGGLP